MLEKTGKKEAKKGLLFGDLSGKNEMEIPLLDYNTIMAATNNFAFVNKLGEGGFGPVYKVEYLYRTHLTCYQSQ